MKINFTKCVMMACCMVVALASCESDGVPNDNLLKNHASSHYLPLEVGNFWDFKVHKGNNDDIVLHREVRGRVNIKGREYFLITSVYTIDQSHVDSAYYRVGSNGNVYLYRRITDAEELKYKLFAADRDTWSYDVNNGDKMNVTVHIVTADMGQARVEGCKAYYFDVEHWADEEQTITLAPGVGFLSEYSNGWGAGVDLKKALIGGSVIEY